MNPQSAAANPLNTPANQSRFALRVEGLSADTFAVKSFTGKGHGLDQDYLFEVFVQSSEVILPGRVVGQGASLELLQEGGEPAVVPGVICSFSWTGSAPDGREYLASLASPLYSLKLRRNHRIFLGRTVPQIIEEVLAGANLGAAVDMALKDEYPLREYSVQYDESDWDFVTRLAAACGIFFRIEADRQKVRVLFHDAVDELPSLPAEDGLLYQVQTGANRDKETIFAFNTKAEVLTDGVDLRDYNYRTPETLLDAPASQSVSVPGHGRAYRFGENHKDLDQGRKLAKLRQQKLDWQRQVHIAETDCRAAAPGLRLTMTGHPDTSLNGDYLIVAVDHQGHQGSGFAYGGKTRGMSYRNRLTLIPFATPYRPKLAEQRLIHGVFTARIETTGGPYAYLDEQGRYRVRLDLDAGDAPTGQASHAARLMQPYAGDTFGSHTPLHAGVEVALTCVNGDLARPVILGVLPNQQIASPVNAANHSQNILRTFGGNELLMEDRKGQERIELFTDERKNHLNLDAKADGHKVRLATMEGEMEIYAAKTMLKESGDTHSTVAGDNHLITVENNQRLMTKNDAIELQAATDIRLQAAANVRLQAEKNDIHLRADKDMVVRAAEGMSVEVRNENLSLRVKNGELSIDVAKEISILGQGGGAIEIAQSGGQITIAPGGAVTIASHTVDINGQSFSLGGSQNSQGGSGGGDSVNYDESFLDWAKSMAVATMDWFRDEVVEEAQAEETSPPENIIAATANTTSEQGMEITEDQKIPEERPPSSVRKVLVRKVDGPENCSLGETATYTASSFNLEDVTEEEKKKINWVVKVAENSKTINTFLEHGAVLDYHVSDSFIGDEIWASPFIHKASPQVFRKTKVNRKKTWDAISNQRIESLHPKIRSNAICFINDVEKTLKIKLRITHGLRTIKEQDALYAIGRDKSGKKVGKVVTNAKGGESFHNYGLAIDVVEINAGKAIWNTEWDKIAKIGEKHGFEWGGSWKTFKDKPHFQKTYGRKIGDLKKLIKKSVPNEPYVLL